MTGFASLEELIYNSALSTVGDPTYLGILILGFFIGFVYLQNTRADVKLMVIVPATFLAVSFIPLLQAVMILGFGIVLMLGLSRIIRI